jgi:hypothetical protein
MEVEAGEVLLLDDELGRCFPGELLNDVKFLTFPGCLFTTYGAAVFRLLGDLERGDRYGDKWSREYGDRLRWGEELRKYPRPGDWDDPLERVGVTVRGRCRVGVLLSLRFVAHERVGIFP